MSIETEITRITNEVATQTDLIGQIATALTNVVIPPAGSGGEYCVTVYDYDGTVLAEANLNEGDVFTLPAAPTHERLIFDGWSSGVDAIDNTVTIPNYDITVGAMYHTASGATEIDIELTEFSGLTFTFRSVLTGMTSIDWGDGTTGSTLTHTYATYGEYTIKVYGMTAIASGSTSGGIVATAGGINSTTKIVNANCTITRVLFSSEVTSIGSYAFNNCNSLMQVTIPNSVRTINTYTFQNCPSLTQVTIPNSVTSIGGYVFKNCYSLAQVIIPTSVTSIPDYAFNYCNSLKQIIIPNGVTSIGKWAFQKCPSLTQVTIPNSVTSIGEYAFSSCYSLTQIIIPNGVTSIGDDAFEYCYSLTHVTIPNSVTGIGEYAFYYCYSLTQVTIPNSVTSIGAQAFNYCNSLKQVTMSSNVTSIGKYAFQGCHAAREYDFSKCTQVPTLASDGLSSVFYSINTTAKIVVPSSLYSTWIATSNWSSLAKAIVSA